MLQQRLARSLQTLSRQSRGLRTIRTPQNTHLFPTSPIASRTIATQRWYSSQNESDKTQEEVLKEEGKGTQDTAKENPAASDPVQKELEVKKKENVELAVS
jgi:molecular chaperone GrpE